MSKVFSTLLPKKRVEVGYRYEYETELPKEERGIHYVLFGTFANEELVFTSLASCAVLFKIFCVKHGFDLLKEDFYKLSL